MIAIIIKVTEVKPNDSQSCLVVFESSLGGAEAEWHGNVPVIGEYYQVNVDICEVLVYGVHIHQAGDAVPGIYTGDEGLMEFTALIESVDPDGYTVFRLGGLSIGAMVVGTDIPSQTMARIRPGRVVIYSKRRDLAGDNAGDDRLSRAGGSP